MAQPSSDPLRKQYEEHAVFARLREVGTALENVEKMELPDDASKAYVGRIRFVLDEVSNRLEVASPYVVKIDVLNNLSSYWNEVNSQLNAYVTNKSAGHLSSANSQVDNVVANLPSLPIPHRPSIMEELGKSMRRAKTEAISHAQEVAKSREATAAAQKDVDALRTRIDQEKDAFSKLQAKLQADFDADAKKRIEDHGKLLQAYEKELADSREHQRGEFQKFLDDQRANQQEEAKKRAEEAQKFEADLATRIKKTQVFLDEKRREVEEVVQATGSASMTGEFQNVGKTAAKSARLWRNLTAAALGVLCLVGIIVLGTELWLQKELKWEEVLARLNVTIPFLLFAGYAAAQARRYHRIEEDNKRVSVELSSIDPYLANLPKDVRDGLKAQLAPRYFQGIRNEKQTEADGLNVPSAVQSLSKHK